MIALSYGDLKLELEPDIGGAVSRFTCAGRNVLRPMSGGTTDVRDAACFPLVPYANRIERGILNFEGQEYRLAKNFGKHPHSLHGYGWHRAWRVESLARDQATIAFDHEANEWPWSFTAQQIFALADGGLTIRMIVRSRADEPMPLSLGLHPYFPRTAGSKVTASVKGMWESDSTQIPTRHVAATTLVDFGRGVVVSKAPFVDHCFTGWDSRARIEQPDIGLEISFTASADCTFFHVFIPEGADFFCAEPVTAMPNAFNRPEPAGVTGARSLAPGGSFSIELKLGVRSL